MLCQGVREVDAARDPEYSRKLAVIIGISDGGDFDLQTSFRCVSIFGDPVEDGLGVYEGFDLYLPRKNGRENFRDRKGVFEDEKGCVEFDPHNRASDGEHLEEP